MVSVDIIQDCDAIRVSAPDLEALVKAVCRRFKVRRATVSVAIVDDRRTRRINRRFMARRGTTDCFSFDLTDTADPAAVPSWEILANGDKAVSEARARGHSPQAELALYVLHGLLHQLGLDDATVDQALAMHGTEDEILEALGYGAVYGRGRTGSQQGCS